MPRPTTEQNQDNTLLYRSLFTLTAASITGAIAFFGLGFTVLPVAGITLLAGAASYVAARLYSFFNQAEAAVQRLNDNTLPTIEQTFTTTGEGVNEFISITHSANTNFAEAFRGMTESMSAMFTNMMGAEQDTHAAPTEQGDSIDFQGTHVSRELLNNLATQYAFEHRIPPQTPVALHRAPTHKPTKSGKNEKKAEKEISQKSSRKAKKK